MPYSIYYVKSRAGGDRAGVPAGKMDEEGLIRKTDFMTVLNHPTSIPCLTSTPLYPDWSFAALPAVSDELADRVTRVLFNAPQNATFRWGAPASTREVEALLRDVRQHPQQRQLWLDVKSWFIQHRLAMGAWPSCCCC